MSPLPLLLRLKHASLDLLLACVMTLTPFILGADAPCDSAKAGGPQREALIQIRARSERHPGTCAYVYTVLLAATEAQSQPDADISARANEFVRKGYIHGVPYEDARSLGPAAVPHLVSLLSDPEERANWGSICSTLGYIGDPTAFQTLKDFVWKRFKGEINSRSFGDIEIAQESIGFIAATSTPAMDYLAKGVNPAFWDSLPWRWGRFAGRALSVRMSEVTIVSLPYSNRVEAQKLLLRLRDHPHDPHQTRAVGSALGSYEGIRAQGVSGYIRSIKRRLGE